MHVSLFSCIATFKVLGGSLFTIFGLTIVNSVWLLLNFNGPGLLFKITFWYWNILLSLVATDGRDGHIYLLNQLLMTSFFICLQKTNKQTKNVAFRLYLEKFTRFSLRFNVLLLTLLHAWAKKKDRWTAWAKIYLYFLIKYNNSRIWKNKNVLFDWLIYNRQILAIHAFVWKKIDYLQTVRG